MDEARLVVPAYFSFDRERDAARMATVRGSNMIDAVCAGGWDDARRWQAILRKGDAAVKRAIGAAMDGVYTTVVCIEAETARRPYVDREIE